MDAIQVWNTSKKLMLQQTAMSECFSIKKPLQQYIFTLTLELYKEKATGNKQLQIVLPKRAQANKEVQQS